MIFNWKMVLPFCESASNRLIKKAYPILVAGFDFKVDKFLCILLIYDRENYSSGSAAALSTVISFTSLSNR